MWHHILAPIVFLVATPPIAVGNPMDGTIGLYYIVNYHSIVFSNRSNHSSAGSRTPPIPRRLVEGGIDTVLFNVSGGDQVLNYDDHIISDFYAEEIVATSRNPRVAKVVNASFFFGSKNFSRARVATDPSTILTSDGELEVALSVQISGHRIGRTIIDISLVGYGTSASRLNESEAGRKDGVDWRRSSKRRESRVFGSFDVAVVRRTLYKKLGLAFTIFVAIMSVFTTFLIGTKLDWKIVLKEIKRPSSLLIGTGLEFFVMPLVAFAWATLILRGNYSWQLAYLAIGACPGGGHSPFWTLMLDGNLDLAVAMSFVASVSALGVLPFWLFTIGRTFYAGRFTIPYVQVTASLFALVCPIFFGLLLKHFFPMRAERVGRIVKHVTMTSFIVAATFGCAVNSYVFALLDWRHLTCGLLLPWCGYSFTYLLARWAFRRSHADSIAIAVENGCLNVAVPAVLIQLSLSQPDSDSSLVVPVAVVIFSPWPLCFYFVALVIKKRMAMPVLPLQISAPAAADARIGGEEPRAVRQRRSQDGDELVAGIAITIASKWADKLPACVSDADASTQTSDKPDSRAVVTVG